MRKRRQHDAARGCGVAFLDPQASGNDEGESRRRLARVPVIVREQSAEARLLVPELRDREHRCADRVHVGHERLRRMACLDAAPVGAVARMVVLVLTAAALGAAGIGAA